MPDSRLTDGRILRQDIYVKEVLGKCESLQIAGVWPNEPELRPRAWLNNFDVEDQSAAAFLLDNFTFYNSMLTDKLFLSAFNRLGDREVLPPQKRDLLQSAVLTPVLGEEPNNSDSGLLFSRKARQVIKFPSDRLVNLQDAYWHASRGGTVIFVDDIVCSGDQFLATWKRKIAANSSFHSLSLHSGFLAIYLCLVVTDYGRERIQRKSSVVLSYAHELTRRSTLFGLLDRAPVRSDDVRNLVAKYQGRLSPTDTYIANNHDYRCWGYKERALMIGFEHSMPDATLPLFWSSGDDWIPLRQRL